MSTVSALPVEYDLQVTRGTDNTIEFTFTTAAGVAIDISADTVILTVRASLGSTRLVQLTNAPGSHSSPVAGKTRFTLTDTHLADASNASKLTIWIYEVRRYIGGLSGDQIVWFHGQLELHPTGGTGA
jgi:hypothetical protein